jgi:hypothetical protein
VSSHGTKKKHQGHEKQPKGPAAMSLANSTDRLMIPGPGDHPEVCKASLPFESEIFRILCERENDFSDLVQDLKALNGSV